jgi:hypothetical protein
MSTNIGELVEITMEHDMEHLERNMSATPTDMVRAALRRRYKSQLTMAACMERLCQPTSCHDEVRGHGPGGTQQGLGQTGHEGEGGYKRACMLFYGWLMRRISPRGMPSHQVEGSVGGML